MVYCAQNSQELRLLRRTRLCKMAKNLTNKSRKNTYRLPGIHNDQPARQGRQVATHVYPLCVSGLLITTGPARKTQQ